MDKTGYIISTLLLSIICVVVFVVAMINIDTSSPLWWIGMLVILPLLFFWLIVCLKHLKD